MNENNNQRDWQYKLPNGTIAPDMEIACEVLGCGSQGFRAMVRKGIVQKIFTDSKTKRYERRIINS